MKKLLIVGVFMAGIGLPMTSTLKAGVNRINPIELVFMEEDQKNFNRTFSIAPDLSKIQKVVADGVSSAEIKEGIELVEGFLTLCKKKLREMNDGSYIKREIASATLKHYDTIAEINQKINRLNKEKQERLPILLALKRSGAFDYHVESHMTTPSDPDGTATDALMSAIKELNFDGVQKAIKDGADVNPSFMGSSPLVVQLDRKLKEAGNKINTLMAEKKALQIKDDSTTEAEIRNKVGALKLNQEDRCEDLSEILTYLKQH